MSDADSAAEPPNARVRSGRMLRIHHVELPAGARLEPHGHPSVHLCVVERGGFREAAAQGVVHCDGGSLRLSPAGAEHELELAREGLAAWVLEYPAATAQLAAASWFARDLRLRGALRSGADFAIECLAYETLASARRGSTRTAAPWLLALRDRPTGPTAHSLRDIARSCGRHPSHVARSFQAHFGRTLGEHRRSARLWQAARRLREGDESLVQIALRCGFYDQAHFTRAFASKFGIAPSSFRRAR